MSVLIIQSTYSIHYSTHRNDSKILPVSDEKWNLCSKQLGQIGYIIKHHLQFGSLKSVWSEDSQCSGRSGDINK